MIPSTPRRTLAFALAAAAGGLAGMVIGLFPVVGVPLPFFSYGGTSMVTSMIGVALLLNICMRRFMFSKN